MKRLLPLFAGVTGLALCFAGPAMAQSARVCAPYPVVAERLAERYAEARVGRGLGADGRLLEVWASPETGSWTVLLVAASGTACLVASGQGYERMDEALTRGDAL